MAKATKRQVQQRLEKVFELILAGAEFADIRQFASGSAEEGRKSWRLSDRQVRRYMTRAYELCERALEVNAKKLLGRHLLQRRQLYAHALEIGDFRTALAILRDEAELQSLYPPARTKHELTGKDGGPLQTEATVTFYIPENHRDKPAEVSKNIEGDPLDGK